MTASSRSVRVGILGTSWWIERMHLPALLSHAGAEVAALCGRRAGPAEALAERCVAAGRPRPAVHVDWRAMLADAARGDRLDAVIVATPDDLHHDMTLAALDAGLHVLCEKPLARTAAEARALWDAAERRRAVHMTYFTYRWLPHYRAARAVVAGGGVGRVRQVHMRWLSAMGRTSFGGTHMPTPRDAWRLDPARSGGVLTDLGPHLVDVLRTTAGEIRRVAASVRTDGAGVLPGTTNDSVVLALEGEAGDGRAWHGTAQLGLAVDVGERGLLQQLLVVGDAGTLEVEVTIAGAELRLARDGRFSPVPIPPSLGGGLAQPFDVFTTLPVGTRLFVDAVRAARDEGRRPPTTPEFASFADGWAAQAVVDATAEAARTGRWGDAERREKPGRRETLNGEKP